MLADHSSLGGVTASKHTLVPFTLVTGWSQADALPPPTAIARDLRTILEYNVDILGSTVPGPAYKELHPLRVHQSRVFGPFKLPVFHGPDYCPRSRRRQPWFTLLANTAGVYDH